MGLTEMPFHCLLKNVSLDLTMGVQNNSSKYCWIGRVFDLIYYSPKVFVTFDLSKVRYRLYNRPMDITINYSCDVIR
ncbi:Uncharacterised protein [Acinetobacter baumannii]|nr:Uncharacterised protein [Acinetobacter baumannii]